MSESPEMVTPRGFVDDGWLLEVNRQFFHPRGFALSLAFAQAEDGSFHPVDKNGFAMCQLQDWRLRDGIEFGKFDAADMAKIANLPPVIRGIQIVE